MFANLKYENFYLRKSGLKGIYGDILLENILKHKPKNLLEIGVYTGVTAINICRLLNLIHKKNFYYCGIDLFEDFNKKDIKEVAPKSNFDGVFFSNPIKNFLLKFIIGGKINSFKSVNNFLNRFSENINLYKGNSYDVLNKINLSIFNYVFLDGGHSFETVYKDLNIIYSKVNKGTVILCDDYNLTDSGVKKAVDTFVNEKKLILKVINTRFTEIII